MDGEASFIVASDEEILIICMYIRISQSNTKKKESGVRQKVLLTLIVK